MSLAAKILGTAAASPIEAIGGVLDGLFTSKEEKMNHQALMAKLALQPGLAQAAINKVEAQHRSIFVAGWRPFIGWTCGLGLAWAFIGHPAAEWAVLVGGGSSTPPTIQTDALMELVIAMLGLGGLRTIEKAMGRAK